MPISKLEQAIMTSWRRITSSDPDNWSENNPAWGQSEASALVMNDYLGGEIVWSNVLLRNRKKGINYYRNKAGHKENRLLEMQFPESAVIPNAMPKKEGYNSTREYLLSDENVLINYNLLKKDVEKYLQENKTQQPDY
ncbi:MAG TPA: hypothetical protein VEC16_07060 [Alphaproteobacteria bacterium]|nr:hypothetical protein [Alphaproteobacteria bacterium]